MLYSMSGWTHCPPFLLLRSSTVRMKDTKFNALNFNTVASMIKRLR